MLEPMVVAAATDFNFDLARANCYCRNPFIVTIPNKSNMRTYLLTEQERKIINKFLDTDEKLEGFKVLLHRCRHSQITIKTDLELVERLLAKTHKRAS